MAQTHEAIVAKFDTVTKEQIASYLAMAWAQERLLYAKILSSQFGKEEAKTIISKAVCDIWYASGRSGAERLGNPQDLDSYVNYLADRLHRNPITPELEIVERTRNRAVFREPACLLAEAFDRLKQNKAEFERFGGEDAFEVAKSRCDHDTARANGFNPKMKFRRTKFFLDGDDCCEFVAEIEE